MTTALYLNDTYLVESNSKITHLSSDEKGSYTVLDQTIFYPQGGGQPSDQGTIYTYEQEIPVHFVQHVYQEIRHYVTYRDENWRGLSVNLKVDSIRRLLNARYHTAGHLLSNIVESIDSSLKAFKGHSFPGEAYVEFIGGNVVDKSQIEEKVNKVIAEDLKATIFEMLPAEFGEKFYKLPYLVPVHKTFRVIRIGDYMPIPCGGTHLSQISEIGTFTIRKISCKGDRTKISYEVL